MFRPILLGRTVRNFFCNARVLETSVTRYLDQKIGNFAAIWGVAGACLLLGFAVMRMAKQVTEGFQHPLGVAHYAVMIPWLFFMLYSEGYKGFQKGYSPRVAARAHYLRGHATWVRTLLAPLFCMGFFDSTKKRKIVICCLLLGVTTLVLLFQYIPQPWRGVLDLGVVLGLSWGILATLIFFFKYWFSDGAGADPEVPLRD